MNPRKILILGAAGRDFHNFNVLFREDPGYRVVAFTATQIPDIAGRRYPAELAGRLYPSGIPIVAEDEMEPLVRDLGIDEVLFSYSDVSYGTVMHLASRAIAAGADFRLAGHQEHEAGSTQFDPKPGVEFVVQVAAGEFLKLLRRGLDPEDIGGDPLLAGLVP